MLARLGRLAVPATGMAFHYYHKQARSSQRDQLRQIKDLGFDVIQTEESPVAPGSPSGPLDPVIAWNHIEIGKDKYDWGFLDRLVEDCEAVGLKLFHDIELVHHLPTWVARKYPGTEWVYPTGETLGFYHRRFCYADYHMRCFSMAHPACRAAAADFMHKVAHRYAASPAVVGYILFEEIGLNYPHDLTWYGQDVGPATVAGFREYLEKEYGTLANLNRRYERKYRDFKAAASDRTIFDAHPRPHRGWMDWCYYRAQYVSRFFRDARDAVKQADPQAVMVASGADAYESYWIVQGFRDESAPFFDIMPHKLGPEAGRQDVVRNYFSNNTRSAVGLSNLNGGTLNDQMPAHDIARKMFAALGMACRWTSLYAWHWYSHDDPKTGKRILHENLRGLLPYVRWIAPRRELFGNLRPADAQVAVLKPERSDAVNFWQYMAHDPRILRKSHSWPSLFTQAGCRIKSFLTDANIPINVFAEERLAEELASGQYRMLLLIDSHLTANTAQAIRDWVDKGGKLLLTPGAGRYDEAGNPRGYFDDLIRHCNYLSLLHRDFGGWKEDGRFPMDAEVVMLEAPSSLQLPPLMKWAGIQQALEFEGDLRPEDPDFEVGTNDFHPGAGLWQGRISVYPLTNPDGQTVYILVQKGTDVQPLKEVPVVWSGGPVRVLRPPSPRSVRVLPAKGKLVLPAWRDVLIMVPE